MRYTQRSDTQQVLHKQTISQEKLGRPYENYLNLRDLSLQIAEQIRYHSFDFTVFDWAITDDVFLLPKTRP